jgi:TubC N-terminal docking domain
MTLPELVEALEAGGVKLSLRLVVDSPRGVMTDQIKTALAAHKPHLLARLGRDAQWEQLAAQRWEPALNDPTPEGAPDSYAIAEREAIQTETLIDPTPD